jgi:hypothetical protein
MDRGYLKNRDLQESYKMHLLTVQYQLHLLELWGHVLLLTYWL